MSANRIVVVGCHVNGDALIEDLVARGYPPAHVVCLTESEAERYAVSGYSDLACTARRHGIAVYRPQRYDLTHPDDIAFFQSQEFDLLLQGGWQRLFRAEVLDSLRVGGVGVHGSPDFLPKGRGRSPLNWSLLEGRRRFILHLFLMTPGVDDGDIFAWEDFDITEFDDIRTLYMKVDIVTRRLLFRNLDELLKGEISTWPQRGEPSYFGKRTAQSGRIDWESDDVWEIYDAIRAQTRPYPGAFAKVDGETVTLWKGRVFDTRMTYPDAAYGEVVERFDGALIVNCRGGLLLVDDWEVRAGDALV
jgi:methionyl-tRNA formyltransferase